MTTYENGTKQARVINVPVGTNGNQIRPPNKDRTNNIFMSSHYYNHCCQGCSQEDLELGKSAKHKIYNIRGHQVQKLLKKLDGVIHPYLDRWIGGGGEDDSLALQDLDEVSSGISNDDGGGKHTRQELSIISHLQRIKAINDDVSDDSENDDGLSSSFSQNQKKSILIRSIELGCGTGRLSDKLQEQTKAKLDHILIDRYPFEEKQCRDRHMRQRLRQWRAATVVQRHCKDIAELDFKDYSTKDCHQIFIMSKHLCGPACDLAISALGNFLSTQNTSSHTDTSPNPPPVLIATCCHYLCTWESYTGKDMWLTLGLSQYEFEVAVALSQWASVKKEKEEEARGKLKRRKTNPKVFSTNDSRATVAISASDPSAKSCSTQHHDLDEGQPNTTTTSTSCGTPNLLELAKKAAIKRDDDDENCTTSASSSLLEDIPASYLDVPSDEFERLFTRKQKSQLGKALKRLLDLGRLSAIQQLDTYPNVELVRYTRHSIDDRLLVAYS